MQLKASKVKGPLLKAAESELEGYSVKERDALLWISKKSDTDDLTLIVDPKTGRSSGFQPNVCGADGPKNLMAGRKGPMVFVRPLFGAKARQEYRIARSKAVASTLVCQFPSKKKMKIVYASDGGRSEVVTLPRPIGPATPPVKEQESKIKIFPAWRATEQQVARFLEDNVVIQGGGFIFEFRKSGTAKAWAWGADNRRSCEEPVSYTLQGNRLSFSCVMCYDACTLCTSDSCEESVTRYEIAIEQFTGKGLVVRYIKGTWSDGEIMVTEDCFRSKNGFDGEPGKACQADWTTSLGLIPGAKNRDLYESVRDLLQGPLPESVKILHILEGPKARHPHVESELFYRKSEDDQKQAQGLADLLRPLIGPVQVKAWPGDRCPYNVALVVGSRAAPEPD